MIDIETQERMTVHTEGTAGPYIMVPLDQLDNVLNVLTQAGIGHSVSADAIQLDGRPVIAVVDFGKAADPRRIQTVLDAA